MGLGENNATMWCDLSSDRSVLIASRPTAKRILYLVVYEPCVPLTGAGPRTAEFVNALTQRFELDLVYISGCGQPAIPELSAKYASGLKGVESKFCVPFSQFDYFIFSRKLYAEAYRLLSRKRYDYLLCDYGLSAVYGILLSNKFKVPLIYCSHNLEYQQFLGKAKKDKRRYLFAPYVYWAEKNAVRKSQILVCITREDAQFYRRWTDEAKMLVIPACFDERVFNPYYAPPRNDPKVVFFCGNFKIQTNREVVDVVMHRILDKVLARHPDTLFRFVGAQAPSQIKHPNVEFTGFVEDYPSYLKAADVVISPMQQGWGFPTKIVEALACGKTTIATPVGGRGLERDLKTLEICETDQFAERICAALERDTPVTPVDFAKLKERYTWGVNLQKLTDRIANS
jgi:glycosyltransferase involved in cell wall biosynthesis